MKEESKYITTLIKKLYQVFPDNGKPRKVVGDVQHCLACSETQTVFDTVIDRRHIKEDDFRLCYIAIDALTKEAFEYIMPRILELTLRGEENEREEFVPQLLQNLIVEDQNRFEHYNLDQVQVVCEVLEVVKKRSYQEDYVTWDMEKEVLTEDRYQQELQEHSSKALKTWRQFYRAHL